MFYAKEFQVFTDNNPLTYALSSAKSNATGQRWVAALADYTFTIKYGPVITHIDADSYLSSCTKVISLPEIKVIHFGIEAISSGKINLLSSLSTNCSILDKA